MGSIKMLAVVVHQIIAEIYRLVKVAHKRVRTFFQVLSFEDVFFANLVVELALQVVVSR